ncbi:NERD domain-containing protein [Lentibacillus sp. CBA3610]|uniref:NERD domain-containing protein n=1 Tax=Lentibacillus sp. CBA3610 TaxID=2518176 RepID=UPI0015963507|nr:NERD domain-containing protein [Lentibacillus sp. CBA3610]QKY69739.1 NERD domain-containing protein [Lentibacillus sp. CBA3610]
MAQLIKLEDYVSRYEWNVYRYASQFIRMKQDNWKKIYDMWLDDDMTEDSGKDTPESAFSKWKSFFKTSSQKMESATNDETSTLPETEKDLKHYFLDKLFPLQLKWASSTVTDVSFMEKDYNENDLLKYFLKRFPDTYLVMYYPIFNVKKAPVDGEIILISPIGIEIIYMIEESPDTLITAEGDRTWLMKKGTTESKILSPLLALKRTEQIVKSALSQEGAVLPVKKVVLSRANHITSHREPYNTKVIGKHDYENWFTEKRQLVSPLKNQQLKSAELLLKNCRTTAVKRPEWEADNSHTFTNGEN